jgi:hypothetical protein
MALTIPTKGAPGQRKAAAKKTPAKKTPAKKTPGKALRLVETTDFTKLQAEKLTEQIGKGFQAAADLMIKAVKGRIWIAYGYKSFEEYRDKELGKFPLALPMLQRKAAVMKLAEAGLSSRAIAAATGTSDRQAARDKQEALDQVCQNGTPERAPDLDDDDEPVDVPEVPLPTTTGFDGKQYPATQPNPNPHNKPEPIPDIVAAAKRLATAVQGDTVKLGNLYDRDDYEEHKAAVDAALQQAIDDFADLVDGYRTFETRV